VPRREAILDPTGQSGRDRAAATLAPRVLDLRGIRLGLLDNAKGNAARVLQTLAAQLRAQHHVGEVSTFTKSYFGTPVEEDRASEIAQSCDAGQHGVGD
jgi:hypothetical protein